jgi:glycosyltransferase involved in cell wall biosynthesis
VRGTSARSTERMHVVRSGARLPVGTDHGEARRRLAAAHRFDLRRPVIAYVGSLEPRKNPLLLPGLLEAVRTAGATRDALLLVAGDGPLGPALRSALDDRRLTDHARLLGHLPDPADVFAGADVVVLLSDVEGLPQVLVQAAAAGTPFVAFEVSGVQELLAAGAVGTAIAPGDVDAAATAAAGHLAAGVRGEPIDLEEWRPDVIRARYAAILEPLLARPGAHVG